LNGNERHFFQIIQQQKNYRGFYDHVKKINESDQMDFFTSKKALIFEKNNLLNHHSLRGELEKIILIKKFFIFKVF